MSSPDWVGKITRMTAWIALAIEAFDFVEKPLGLNFSGGLHDGLEKVGILLFLISLVSWLEGSNKGLEKLDKMAIELQSLAVEAKKIDLVAKYGANAVWLARLLHPQDGDSTRYPHCRAGGETLSYLLLNTYTQSAAEFHRLRTGDINEVKLREYSVINIFLENLVQSLPPKSVWLGISRLQDSGAWEQGSAEPSYYQFERAAESRVEGASLRYLRVLCFESRELYLQMSNVARRQLSKGLQLRSIVGKPMPHDLSLIWVPAEKPSPKLDLKDPIGFLEKSSSGYEPLCGLSFEIRGDREVYTMALVIPKSDDFAQLTIQFRNAWTAAEDYAPVG